jgi:hypothetical protein
MSGIRDTAYPQMKSAPSARELADVYTPNFVELVWAEKRQSFDEFPCDISHSARSVCCAAQGARLLMRIIVS